MSVFLVRFKANYLARRCGYNQLFFVDSDSPCKDLPFLCGFNLAQKTFAFSKYRPKYNCLSHYLLTGR